MKNFFFALLVIIISSQAFGQKKKDILIIETLIQQGRTDSAAVLLEPYILKFPDNKQASIYLGKICYGRAQQKFWDFYETDNTRCYLLISQYEKASALVSEISRDYNKSIDLLKKGEYPNLNITTIHFTWMHAGYYFDEPLSTGSQWKYFGMKKVEFDNSSDEKIWDYASWCAGWFDSMGHWIPEVQTQLVNIYNNIEANDYCRTCTEINFKSNSFKREYSTVFMLDKAPLSSYILWYKCFKKSYLNLLKKSFSSDRYNEVLKFINFGDSILKICEQKNEESQFEKYKAFFDKYYNGEVGVNQYIKSERAFINIEKESISTKIIKKDEDKRALIDTVNSKWAKFENNLIPLVSDLQSNRGGFEMPLTLGDYENKINNQIITYETFSRTNYSTNYVTSESSSTENKVTKYVIGEFINKTRYKKDTDVFVAKIDANEKDLNKKVIWLKTFDNQNSDGHTFDSGKTLCLTKDGGCIITFIVEDEGNVFVKLDKDGNELWRKWRPQPADWLEANRAHNYQVFSPQAMLEDKDGNVITFFSTGGTSDFAFLKMNSANGKILWEKKFVKDLKFSIYQGLFGGIIEIPNQGYMLLLNFDKITDQFGNEFKSRAIGQYNIAALKLDYSLLYTSLYPYISDEPRYVNSCELTKENTIKCYGRRGNYHEAGDPMNYNLRKNLQYSWPDTKNGNNSFFMEIDLNGKILKTNGME